MEYKSKMPKLLTAIIVIFTVLQGCTGAQLMCYVCENCPQVNKDTPQQLCDESFFNSDSSSTTTTTTTMETTRDTSTEIHTTDTTEAVTDETTTSTPYPTPPTVSPPSPTTTNPTPPTVGTLPTDISIVQQHQQANDNVTFEIVQPNSNNTSLLFGTTEPTILFVQPASNLSSELPNISAVLANGSSAATSTSTESFTNALPKSYVPSAELRVQRQRRSYYGPSYHCFVTQVISAGGNLTINRGCSRVQPSEGVCEQQNATVIQHGESLNKCSACTAQLCNSSSTFGLSAMALLMLVVASFLHSN